MTTQSRYIFSWMLLTMCALFNVLGGVTSKAWQHNRSSFLLILCCVSFLIDLAAWIGALYLELDVGLGSILFIALTTLIGLCSGFYFSQEPITIKLIIGGALVLLGAVIAAS